MRTGHVVGLLAVIIQLACGRTAASRSSASIPLDVEHAAAIRDSVRAFAVTVAQGISARGPSAWRGYFADDSAFFMASEGHLVFANSDAATRGIEGLTRMIAHVELHWSDPIRVDALAPGFAVLGMNYHETRVDSAGRRIDESGYFTGVAEHRGSTWQLRDAHWSVLTPPEAVP